MIKSPFNPSDPLQSQEGKIIVALERISEAFRVLLWNEGKDHGLSPIQLQLLIFLLFHPPEKCKVSFLAAEFNMTKATISDSVKTLLQKALVQKTEDVQDTRSFTLSLTKEGRQIARKAASFASVMEQPLATLSPEQKDAMLSGLLQLIRQLNEAGIITVQRMCFSCRYYSQVKGHHYCALLQARLAAADLRVDCPEHIAAT